MGKIRRIIPFGFWPSNWGMAGKRREEAEAEYYWSGEDLDYRLLDIRHDDQESKEYRTAKLKLDYRYHKVGEFDYGLGLLENNEKLTESSRAREIAKYLNRFGKITAEDLEYQLFELSYEVKDTEAYFKEKLKLDVRFGKKTEQEADQELLDHKFDDKSSIDYKKEQLVLDRKWGKISENEFEKQTATLDKEPWFDFIGADKKITGDAVQAAVELDWNDYFVEFLESKGWSGSSPDEIVDKWFEDMMKQMLNVYEEDLIDDGSENPMPLASHSRTKRDDGLTEYR